MADRGPALHPPARRDVAGVEEQGIADVRFLKVPVDDLGDRNRGLPLPVRMRHGRHVTAVHERELAALEQHAAISAREPPAALRSIGDHLTNGELPCKGFALGLEIDASGEAIELMVSGIRRTKL